MKKLFVKRVFAALALLGVFSLFVSFGSVTEASEVDNNVVADNFLDNTLYTEVSPDDLIIKDENGTLLDPNDFTIYEKVTFSRGQIIEKNYSVQRTNYHGFFTSSIYVSFRQTYNWSGTLYFVNGGQAWEQSWYWAIYSGTVYANIR